MTLEVYIQKLDAINKKLATLQLEQEEIKKQILKESGMVHFDNEDNIIDITKEGQYTLDAGKYKVTVKTDFIYSIDSERYKELSKNIPKEYNPIVVKEKYDINKALFRKMSCNAPKEIQVLLSDVVSRKFAKPYISYKYI